MKEWKTPANRDVGDNWGIRVSDIRMSRQEEGGSKRKSRVFNPSRSTTGAILSYLTARADMTVSSSVSLDRLVSNANLSVCVIPWSAVWLETKWPLRNTAPDDDFVTSCTSKRGCLPFSSPRTLPRTRRGVPRDRLTGNRRLVGRKADRPIGDLRATSAPL